MDAAGNQGSDRRSVFDSPDELCLDRKLNPHVAFGSGPHTCVGALHARVLFRILLKELSARFSSTST